MSVKIVDAKDIVEAARVDPTYYSFDGESARSPCIVTSGTEWRVFLNERGSRYEERTFASEDDARVWFLKRSFQLWQAR